MAAFLPSAHAPKRAVAAFGEELVPILRLNMAAGHVQVTWRKHATRKPVKVQHVVSNTLLFVRLLTRLVIQSYAERFHSRLPEKLLLNIRVRSGARRLCRLQLVLQNVRRWDSDQNLHKS